MRLPKLLVIYSERMHLSPCSPGENLLWAFIGCSVWDDLASFSLLCTGHRQVSLSITAIENVYKTNWKCLSQSEAWSVPLGQGSSPSWYKSVNSVGSTKVQKENVFLSQTPSHNVPIFWDQVIIPLLSGCVMSSKELNFLEPISPSG